MRLVEVAGFGAHAAAGAGFQLGGHPAAGFFDERVHGGSWVFMLSLLLWRHRALAKLRAVDRAREEVEHEVRDAAERDPDQQQIHGQHVQAEQHSRSGTTGGGS